MPRLDASSQGCTPPPKQSGVDQSQEATVFTRASLDVFTMLEKFNDETLKVQGRTRPLRTGRTVPINGVVV